MRPTTSVDPGTGPPGARDYADAVDGPADYPGNASWFEDHYRAAPTQIVEFLGGDGLSMEGKRVADVGTGDGILALGLFHLARPKLLIGYDLNPVNTELLLKTSQEHGIGELPEGLQFQQSLPDHVPAEAGTFDYVISWSAFEHIADPLGVAREMRRIVAPDGLVMIQLFPFYYSERGDHGWTRSSFEHLVTGVDQPGVELNRITLDDLHDTLRSAGLRVSKVELIHFAFHLPPALDGSKLSDLAIGGVKLIAAPVGT